MTPIALIGGGGHARSVMEMMPDGFTVCGYVDNAPIEDMTSTWLGNDDSFQAESPECPVHISLVWGSATDMSLRRRLIERYRKHPAPTLIASSAIVTPHTEIGRGCAVMHRAVINGAKVGDYCVINTGAIIEHGVRLGENVFVGPGAVICGGVTIGNDCIIGAGATIRNGVTIAAGVTVGMGAAVTSDITAAGTYAGVPAKPLAR